jgi:hypothetical protein
VSAFDPIVLKNSVFARMAGSTGAAVEEYSATIFSSRSGRENSRDRREDYSPNSEVVGRASIGVDFFNTIDPIADIAQTVCVIESALLSRISAEKLEFA